MVVVMKKILVSVIVGIQLCIAVSCLDSDDIETSYFWDGDKCITFIISTGDIDKSGAFIVPYYFPYKDSLPTNDYIYTTYLIFEDYFENPIYYKWEGDTLLLRILGQEIGENKLPGNVKLDLNELPYERWGRYGAQKKKWHPTDLKQRYEWEEKLKDYNVIYPESERFGSYYFTQSSFSELSKTFDRRGVPPPKE